MISVSYIVGAYAASPTDTKSKDFAQLYQRLADNPLVGGLELPSHHLADPAATAAIAAAAGPAGWRHIVTCFPGTMFALADDPTAGLAADDDAARGRAVARMRALAEHIAGFVAAGGGEIGTVLLHSAPRGGSAAALRRSLTELADIDWGTAELAIEHSDTPAPGHTAEKGFLTLDDELAAVADLPNVGVLVNWGRSALETRSADGPVRHLDAAAAAGKLTGLMFSGVADTDNSYGAAWTDGHLPPTPVAPASLMTVAEMARSLQAAGDPKVLGAKVSARKLDGSAGDPSLQDRLGVIEQTLRAVEQARQTAPAVSSGG